jgi:hypothetical protein
VRAIDTVAWTETLGVGRKELPWALKAKARQVADLYEDVNRIRATLAHGPDEELVMMLTAATRSLAAAGTRIAETLGDVNRTA